MIRVRHGDFKVALICRYIKFKFLADVLLVGQTEDYED